MSDKIYFYQNNPCVIVRDINEEFAEIRLSHHFASDMELTGQCEGCNVGDSDNKLSCTCDQHSWIIEEVQEEADVGKRAPEVGAGREPEPERDQRRDRAEDRAREADAGLSRRVVAHRLR